ncbi:MAG: type II toxin-antitoxin system VapC family toxin [Bacteroidales bacterium]|nr:type II toxin-antitoxin system VapC family toxin [Bacteroidales bacterium]
MKIFLDTSSLFKLYHKESGTQELMDFFNKNTIEGIFLAELTEIEFSSVIWKKCRKKEIDEKVALTLIEAFEKDSENFNFVSESTKIRQLAKKMIRKYWKEGLRTLDSIQLASVLMIRDKIDFFFTSDNLLAEIASFEKLKVK